MVSADGQSGLVVSRADGSNATFLAPVSGTNHPLPSAGEWLAWAPDGNRIAFVSATDGPEDAANGDPMVITRYLYKPTAAEGMTRFNDNRRVHVFMVDRLTNRVHQLTSGIHYEHSIDWSPDGDEILFVSNREPDPDRTFNYDIFAVRVDDRTVRRVTDTPSAEYQPRWSPDGRTIAYLGTRRSLTSSETTMEDTHVWAVQPTAPTGARSATAWTIASATCDGRRTGGRCTSRYRRAATSTSSGCRCRADRQRCS